MENYGSFDFLKKIYYERMAGTEAELKTAQIIIQECMKNHVEAHLEEFEIDAYHIKEATLETSANRYEVTGIGMSGSTSPEGLEAPFVVMENLNQMKSADLEGKIVFLNMRIVYSSYKVLCEKKAAGFICCSGSLYDDRKNTDLEWMRLRPTFYQFGKIPGVCIRMMDAQKLLAEHPEKVRITLIEEEYRLPSHNVVATIEGSTYPDETIVFTAHYDSVRFSKGAYDNGTGSATILELLSYFSNHLPKRTLKFIWCGAEELGLLGSKAYVADHQEELKKILLCINVDMTGVLIGYDCACCTTQMSVVQYLDYFGKELGFPISVKQGVYSSDSTPFADNGVPAISFARLAPRGGSEIHSRKDVIDFLDEDVFYATCRFITAFSERLISSVVFPVEQGIPEKMKEELDYYYLRKERNNG